jgi:hypothetical protein
MYKSKSNGAKNTSALSLILGSMLTLFVLGSSIEAVPHDAPWACWMGIWLVAAVSVLTGILGANSLSE